MNNSDAAGKVLGKRILQSFTILELLLVIAVIVILAGLLLPSLQNAKAISRRISCINNLKQLGTGLIMYANDSNGMFPRDACEEPWPLMIAEYISYHRAPLWGPPIFHCPDGKIYSSIPTGRSRGYILNGHVARNDYGINGRMHPKTSRQMLLIEQWMPEWGYTETSVTDANDSSRQYWSVGGTKYERIAPRHLKRLNYSNKDGSANSTKVGISGYGEDPIWFFYTDFRYWKDGSVYN